MRQLNERDMALRRIALRRSCFAKVVNARRMPPSRDLAEGCFEQKSGFAIQNGFGKPPGLMSDRQRSKFLGIHLAQPARLEARGHQGKIAAGKDAASLAVIEADGDPDHIRPAPVRIDQRLFDLRLAAAGHDNLSSEFTISSAAAKTRSTPF